MGYLINPKVFYYMSVLESLEFLLIGFGVLFVIFLLTIAMIYMINKGIIADYPRVSDAEREYCEKIEKRFKPILIILLLLLFFGIPVFIPSEQTMVKMLVASQVTTENIETVQKSATELIDYIVDKINESQED